MEGTPKELDIKEVTDTLNSVKNMQIEEITEIHDLHIWSLNAEKMSISCHVITDEPNIALAKATAALKDKFGLGHVTIQTEFSDDRRGFVCKNEMH